MKKLQRQTEYSQLSNNVVCSSQIMCKENRNLRISYRNLGLNFSST